MHNRNKVLTLVICLLLVLTLVFTFACNPKTTTTTKTTTTSVTTTSVTTVPVVAKEWVLPVLAPLTGPMAMFGLSAEWATQYAAKVVNDAGGARGVPIKIVSYDAPGDPAKAVNVMSEALGKNPLFILGPQNGVDTGAVLNLLKNAGVPFCAYFNDHPTQMQYAPLGTFFMPSSQKGAKYAMIEWVKLHPEIKSVAIIDYAGGVSGDNPPGAKEGLDQIGVKWTEIPINLGQDIDMGPIVTRAMALNVDGYYLCTFGMDSANIMKALSDRGMNDGWRIHGGGQALGPEIFTVAQNYNEGVYFWELFNLVSTSTEFQTYVKDFEAAHDGTFPYTWANWGFYLGVKAFAAAIEAENITGDPAKLAAERAAIRDYFWNTKDIPGFGTDTFSYSDEGRVSAPMYLYVVKNNQLSIVKTVDMSGN